MVLIASMPVIGGILAKRRRQGLGSDCANGGATPCQHWWRIRLANGCLKMCASLVYVYTSYVFRRTSPSMFVQGATLKYKRVRFFNT